MSLRKDEYILAGVPWLLGIEAHDEKKRYGNDIRGRRATGGVAAACFRGRKYAVDAQLRRFVLQQLHGRCVNFFGSSHMPEFYGVLKRGSGASCDVAETVTVWQIVWWSVLTCHPNPLLPFETLQRELHKGYGYIWLIPCMLS
jgi:hypothetical protein